MLHVSCRNQACCVACCVSFEIATPKKRPPPCPRTHNGTHGPGSSEKLSYTTDGEATGTLAGYTGTPSAPRHPASCGVRYCTTVLALDAFGYDGKWAVSVDHYSMDSAEAAEGTLSNGDKLFS